MLLNYLLSFSILIMSVVKTADLFKNSNSKLNRTKNEFIALTRKKHNQGSLSLNGALFATMFSLLLIFFSVKFRVELQEARYRRDSYLCMHYLNIKTSNYIFDLSALNWTLRSAYAATLASTPNALVIFKSFENVRDVRHGVFLREIFSYRYCTKEMTAQILLKLPFKTKATLILDTNIDGTTKLRAKKWKLPIYKIPSGIRFKNSFCLQSEYEMEGVMLPNLKIITSEISREGISKLKCLSGYQ